MILKQLIDYATNINTIFLSSRASQNLRKLYKVKRGIVIPIKTCKKNGYHFNQSKKKKINQVMVEKTYFYITEK
ncbi:hypothetical protein GCM10022393_28010 [Aquimarina addita]|uniref:Uncharacterized protein n=1 Tax=Aquimarina addita TaxID=870485 RepID=A0ABP6UPJ3_9FLAO